LRYGKAACDSVHGWRSAVEPAMQHRMVIDGEEDDRREEIVRLEARIDELTDTIARCRKFILASKLAVIAGMILLAAVVFGAIRFDPVALVGAVAVVLGGTVLFGSNTSTLQQALAALRSAEAERAALIGRIKLRLVAQNTLTSTLH
jgi:hypothetical protein